MSNTLLISNTLDEELCAIGLVEEFGALDGLDGEFINGAEGILTEITIGSREADATLKREHAAETKEIERLMEPFMMGSWMEQ